VTRATTGRRARRSTGIRDVLHVASSSAILPLTALLTGPLLARALDPVGRGYVAAILAPLTLAPLLFGIGFPDATASFVAAGKTGGRTALRTLVPLGAAMGILAATTVFLTAPLLLHRYPDGILGMRVLALVLVVSMSLDIVRGIRYGEGDFARTSRERYFSASSRCAVLVVLYATHHLTIMGAVLATQLTSLAAELFLLKRREVAPSDPTEISVMRRKALDYGVRASGGQLAGLLTLRLDSALMLPLAGAEQLGYYAVAVSLAEIPAMLVGQVRSLLLSEFSARHDPQWVAKACRISLLLITITTGGAMLLTPWALPLLFGGAFRPAVEPALILLVATVPGTLVGVLAAAMTAFGRPLTTSVSMLPGLAVTVIGLPLVVPHYGANGAAVVSLVSYVAVFIVLLRLTCQHLNLRAVDLLLPSIPEAVAVVTRRRRATSEQTAAEPVAPVSADRLAVSR
jgi:O-antigen/teichoic acid export membrane protein